MIDRVKKQMGLGDQDFSVHAFRRAFAVMYMDQGGDLFKLSREMGHSDVSITGEYLKSFGSRQARKDHNTYSSVALLRLGKRSRKKRREEP